MEEIPSAIFQRRDAYCGSRSLDIEELRGWGLDGFVWQTTQDSILKVFRREKEFTRELAVYRRLQSREVERLQGFHIPVLLHYDMSLWILELSYVRPPFVLDFAEARLDACPPGFDPDSPEMLRQLHDLYGNRWAEVRRLLHALMHLGIYYVDVHRDNIRVEGSI